MSSSNSWPIADFSMSSSPCRRYRGPTDPDSICFRTAAGVVSGMEWRSERLQDRAHDRAGELGGHPIQRVLILSEEDARIDLYLAARSSLVVLSKHEVGIFPQHLAFTHIVQRHPGAH